MSGHSTPRVLAVDVGGTFTDVVFNEGGDVRHAKAPTTPGNMHDGVRAAISKVTTGSLADVDYLFHGTTAIINALIERDGATTGLLTTAGFRDVYEIGRGGRSDAFDMFFEKPKPYVPRRRRLEVEGRIDGSGEELVPLDEDGVVGAGERLVDAGTESVAVCYLNSYLDPSHEERTATLLAEAVPALSVTTSSDLVREWREFERISTTVMNAYVLPLVDEYVAELEAFLDSLSFGGELLFLQSSGGSMSAAVAREQPLALVESGPSAGIVGTAVLAEHLDFDPVVSFDVGGTTAKASLVEGFEPATTRPYYVGGERHFPSLLPSVDVTEIGAGGGSIAHVDEGGGLTVGPRSAGADPGPVCYGEGGTEPTVTDAHVVLGRINPQGFLGGEMALDVAAARDAIAERVADPLGLPVIEAAQGILDIADDGMALLLREQSVERGIDPRALSLVAGGGAGPLHVTTIARRLGVPDVVVPVMPANFSAFGMLQSDARHERIRTVDLPFERADADRLEAGFERLADDLVATLTESDLPTDRIEVTRQFELCYEGQSHYVTVDVDGAVTADGLDATAADFHARHEERYGFAAEAEPIHVQHLRVVARAALEKPDVVETFRRTLAEPDGEPTTRAVVFDGEHREVPIHTRAQLSAAGAVTGPAVIEEPTSTTVLHAGDVARVDDAACIRIEVNTGD